MGPGDDGPRPMRAISTLFTGERTYILFFFFFLFSFFFWLVILPVKKQTFADNMIYFSQGIPMS